MLIFLSAFKSQSPMNKARINSFCHGESARAPALYFHPVEAFSQETCFKGGDGKVCGMTFFLVRDFLETAFPLQLVSLPWLLHCRVREGLGGAICFVVKLSVLKTSTDLPLPFFFSYFFFP